MLPILNADLAADIEKLAAQPRRVCRVCGCHDLDCSGCVERTGRPCFWVEADLCSACVEGTWSWIINPGCGG